MCVHERELRVIQLDDIGGVEQVRDERRGVEAWPQVQLEGVEWSRPLALLARWHCGFARVRRGDMWRDDWREFALVYLFQRPDTMARAWAKAAREMAAGAWLVSLEFEVPGATPHARLLCVQGKPVWVYRVGGGALRARSTATLAGR